MKNTFTILLLTAAVSGAGTLCAQEKPRLGPTEKKKTTTTPAPEKPAGDQKAEEKNTGASPAPGKKGAKVKKEKHHGPPSWAPAHGYRRRFVYFPKQETYYDNQKGVYISKDTKDPSKWSVSMKVPEILKNIDLGKATKVELDHEADGVEAAHEEIKKKFPITFKVE